MKKLNVQSFYLILSGLVISWLLRIQSTIDTKNRDFQRLTERRAIDPDKLETLRRLLFGFSVIVTVIYTLILLYFIIRILKNRKEAQSQGYLTFLKVVCIILAVFNFFSILFGNYVSIIGLIVNGCIIAGAYIQQKSAPNEA